MINSIRKLFKSFISVLAPICKYFFSSKQDILVIVYFVPLDHPPVKRQYGDLYRCEFFACDESTNNLFKYSQSLCILNTNFIVVIFQPMMPLQNSCFSDKKI